MTTHALPLQQSQVSVAAPGSPRKPQLNRSRFEDDDPERTTKTVPRGVESRISALKGGGASLPAHEREFFEQRMGQDFSRVRIHTDSAATRTANALNARAYTLGSDIVFNKGEYRPGTHIGRKLLAHELTHVVQQHPLQAHWHGLQRHAIGVSRTDAQIQRLPAFIGDRLNDVARHIPGYTLFTYIIGTNPLTGDPVKRSGATLLEGLMGLVPFGTLVFDSLNERGIIGEAGAWLETQLGRLNLSLARIEQTIEAIWDEVSITNSLSTNIDIAKRHFNALYNDVRTFAGTLIDHLISLIEKAAIEQAERLLADNKAWQLIKKILGRDPLRGTKVKATTAEILADFLRLIGKETELEQMRKRGTLQETADWLDTQLGRFLPLLDQLKGLFRSAWDAIQPQNLPKLPQNLRGLIEQTGALLKGVWNFAADVASTVLGLIKRSLLDWLSGFAHEIPGFHLLTVILGKNPFTGAPVERSPRNIIKGFITLIPGGEAQFQQLEQTGTIEQAAQRIEGAMQSLGISWEGIKGLFSGIWDSLSIDDLLEPVAAFQRVMKSFGGFIERLFTFVKVVVKEVIFLILKMMNFPTDIVQRIIANAMAAFADIKRDPIGFFKNMLASLKLGFGNFFSNIAKHLLNGVTDWLFGQLEKSGVQRPADLSFKSILTMVLQILNISTERIWQKLADRIGEDKVQRIRGAIDKLTGIWSFIREVQQNGVAAIWKYVKEQLNNLWDMVLTTAKDWIVTRIIQQVTKKLLSMLDPTGIMAVVNSFVAVFNAIQSAIEYLREMLLIVDDYVATVADIAAGNLQSGAKKLEEGLARSIPVAIGFLANQVGLGNIGKKIAEVISGVRAQVDKALDWLLDKAVKAGSAFLKGIKNTASKVIAWWEMKFTNKTRRGTVVKVYFKGVGKSAALKVKASPETNADEVIAESKRVHETFKSVGEKDPGSPVGKAVNALKNAWESPAKQLQAVRDIKNGGGEPPKTQVKALAAALTVLKSLAEDVLAAQPELATTQQRSGGLKGGFGSRTTAFPLTLKGPKGSAPSGTGDQWAALRNRRTKSTESTYYIQGHLLNEKLHGKGVWDNMIPLTRSANGQHSSKIEELVKARVWSLATNQAVYYDIQAQGAPPPEYNKGDLHKRATEEGPRLGWGPQQIATAHAIIDAEAGIPSGLTVDARRYELLPGHTFPTAQPALGGVPGTGFKEVEKIPVASQEIVNKPSWSMAEYYPDGVPPMKLKRLNLSDPGDRKATVYQMLDVGIGPAVAERLYSAPRPFPDWDAVQKVKGMGPAKRARLEEHAHVSLNEGNTELEPV